MKKFLFLFLLLGCSDQETVKPVVTPFDEGFLGANARIESIACQPKRWYNALPAGVGGQGNTYTYGTTVAGTIYCNNAPGDAQSLYPVAPFSIKLKFKNMSTTKSVKICFNANCFPQEVLSPLEEYTPEDPLFYMMCDCFDGSCPLIGTTDPRLASMNYNFKISSMFSPGTVDVQMTSIISNPGTPPNHWWDVSGSATYVRTTTWIVP